MEQRVGGDGGLPPALRTLEPALSQGPPLAAVASRAAETIRPAQLCQVLATRLLGSKPRFEFKLIPRVFLRYPRILHIVIT